MPAPVSTERLFLALPLPPSIQELLAPLAQPLPGVTWTRPAQLHVTLRFLGDVTVDRIDAILERLAAVHVGAFVLPLEGVGTFPPNRPPRVVWIGVGSAHPRLFQLRQRVDDALLAAALPLEVRNFHPHVTLGRCSGRAAGLPSWLHTHREFAAPPFRVAAFDLCSSVLQPSGAVHSLRRRFPLAAPGSLDPTRGPAQSEATADVGGDIRPGEGRPPGPTG
ncbi:MAG: RNA 2',3'-cyclic phosphodiesterase [Verrucomicrobia bacterium]|nr:RNA 2',3'-cyclic phosphodiesterase [Verrucomicrobiota bacterium]